MTVIATPSPTTVALNAVVCLDGSARAADALEPAVGLAERHGETISVIALDPDGSAQEQLRNQLAGVGLDPDAMTIVTSRSQMRALLLEQADAGATPVLSAFGHSDSDHRLGGMLGDLIRSDVKRALAIGPHAGTLESDTGGCLIVSADGVCSVEPLIEATGTFMTDTTPKIVVVHVVPPSEPTPSFSTNRNTAKFSARFDVPVEAAAVAGLDISKTIATLARDEGAALILARSWHRFSAQQPPSASSSLSIVAEAPCPVLIVN